MSTYQGYISTLDAASGSVVLDYSPVLHRIPKPGGDVKLLPLIPKVADLTDTVLYWMESALTPITVTALSSGAGALTAAVADVDLALASGEVAAGFITTGTILRDKTAGKKELVLVTSISSDTCTVTRCYGLTSADANTEAHAVSAEWEVVGHLNLEGSSFGTPTGRTPTRRSNNTSIIDDQCKMTGTEMARNYYSINDYWNWQLEGTIERFLRIMERHVIWSKNVARSDAASGYGSMAGVGDIIIDRAGDNYNTSFGAFGYGAWDNAIKTIWTNGHEDGNLVMLIPPTGLQQAAYIHESAFRGDYSGELTRGMRASALMSTMGVTVPMIPSTVIQSDEFMILDLSRIKLHYMVGRELIAMPIEHGTQGQDYIARRILSEMSLELHNADTAHYFARGVTYAVPS